MRLNKRNQLLINLGLDRVHTQIPSSRQFQGFCLHVRRSGKAHVENKCWRHPPDHEKQEKNQQGTQCQARWPGNKLKQGASCKRQYRGDITEVDWSGKRELHQIRHGERAKEEHELLLSLGIKSPRETWHAQVDGCHKYNKRDRGGSTEPPGTIHRRIT